MPCACAVCAQTNGANSKALLRIDIDFIALCPPGLRSTLDQYRIPPYIIQMSHTIKNKSKLISRVRRIKGQIEAVERALEAELGCADVLMLVASVRGAVSGLTSELLEDHIRHHVVDPAHEQNPEKAKGAADLIDVVRTYLK
jgi:DNA-binding FrmR family transcriptional regulator